MKIKSLAIAFENIAIRTAKKAWIFKCCHNQFILDQMHEIVYELVSNVRSFAFNLFEDRGLSMFTTRAHEKAFSQVPSVPT